MQYIVGNPRTRTHRLFVTVVVLLRQATHEETDVTLAVLLRLQVVYILVYASQL